MTDQTIPDVTDEERMLAREWAESIESATNSVESTTNPWSDRALAAARVLLAVLPQRPTLADMTEEERAACLRMQCDTAPNRSVRGFIADVYPGGCRVIERETWEWRSCSDDMVTPRPDLPRMEWPGDTPHKGPKVTFSMPAPTAPVKVGDVIESADDPRIAELPVGSVLSDCDGETVAKRNGEWVGIGYIPIPSEGAEFGPWKVMRIGWGADQ